MSGIASEAPAGLTFFYAVMGAGKSAHLLRRARRRRAAGVPVTLFTAALDTRAGVGCIASRNGQRQSAQGFTVATDFPRVLAGCQGEVLVDEAQFLAPVQARALHAWAHQARVPVVCYGLRSDFRGEPFLGAAALFAVADAVRELPARCACGRRATLQLRLNAHGERLRTGAQVCIGGAERYRPVCPTCFYGTT